MFDEIGDKLLELEDFSITYTIASSKLVNITFAGSGWQLFKEFEILRVQIFTGTQLCV